MAVAEVQSHETTLKPKKIRFSPWRPGPLVLLLPALASIGAISIYPVLLGLWLSFRDTTLASPTDTFIGLATTSSSFPTASFGTPGSTRSSLPPHRRCWRRCLA